MQAEEVQAWLEEPTPSTRDILVVVPDTSSHDTSMYIAVPERVAWQTHDRRTSNEDATENDANGDQELHTIAIGQAILLTLLSFYIIGKIIQLFLGSFWAYMTADQ